LNPANSAIFAPRAICFSVKGVFFIIIIKSGANLGEKRSERERESVFKCYSFEDFFGEKYL
jgi:hypothetical protein